MLIKSPDDKKKRLRLLEDLRKSDRLDERGSGGPRKQGTPLAQR